MVKCEVNTTQEKTFQDIAKKISNASYQFRKKDHEHQHCLNCGVGEAISFAIIELINKSEIRKSL